MEHLAEDVEKTNGIWGWKWGLSCKGKTSEHIKMLSFGEIWYGSFFTRWKHRRYVLQTFTNKNILDAFHIWVIYLFHREKKKARKTTKTNFLINDPFL